MGFGSLFLNLIKNMDVHPLLQNIIMNVNYNNYGRAREDDDNHTKMWYETRKSPPLTLLEFDLDQIKWLSFVLSLKYIYILRSIFCF